MAPEGHAPQQYRPDFAEVALPHLDLLYRVAYRLTGDKMDAEDLVQEAYLRALRNYEQLREPGAIKTWLLRILTNLHADFLRRCGRDPQPMEAEHLDWFSLYDKVWDEDPFPYSDQLHEDFLKQFTSEDVLEALLNLPDIHRVPVVLAFVDGFSYRDLARIMDCPEGTVMSRLHRGRRRLEKALWDCAVRRGYVRGDAP